MAHGQEHGHGLVEGRPGGLQGPGNLRGRNWRADQIHDVCFLPFPNDPVLINSSTSGTILKLVT